MPALSGEPWRGAAVARLEVTAAPTNFHSAWVSFDVNSSQPSGDQSTWEGVAGGSMTLRFRWNTGGTGSGTGAANIPNFATIHAMLPGGASLGSWSVPFPAAGTEVTRTIHFDDNPMNAVLGAARCGMIELYIIWGNTGGVAPWTVDSRGVTTGTILGTDQVQNARGYARAPVVISNDPSPSNVSIGGAVPSTFAAPDPIHTRLTLSAVKYRSVGLEMELVRTGTSTMEREQTLTQTAIDHDYSWTGTTGNNRRVGNGMFLGSEAKDLKAKMAALDFGGDNEYVFATSGHNAGWTRDSALEMTNTSEVTIDPRLYPTSGNMADWAADRGALFHTQAVGSVFLDPPSSGDVDSGQRVFPDVGYFSTRYINAREEGVNGLVVTLKDWDTDNVLGSESSPVGTFSGTTRTSPDSPPVPSSPEAGWLPKSASGTDENTLPLTWAEVASGTWRVKSVVTSPTDLTGLENYPLSDSGEFWNRNVFFITTSANFKATVEVHPENIAGHGTHLTSEDSLVPVSYLEDHSTHTLVPLIPANGDSAIIKLKRTHHPTMRQDYFDFVAEEWVEKTNGGSVPSDAILTLVKGSVHTVGGDVDVFTSPTHIGGSVFTPDPGGELDFIIETVITKNGVPYAENAAVILVGPNFRHNSYNETTVPHDHRSSLIEEAITGTASINNDSGTVTGSGTAFTTELEVGRLVRFGSDTEIYEIFRIDSDTSMRIFPYYTGVTGSGKTIVSPGSGHVHAGDPAGGGDGSAQIPDKFDPTGLFK